MIGMLQASLLRLKVCDLAGNKLLLIRDKRLMHGNDTRFCLPTRIMLRPCYSR